MKRVLLFILLVTIPLPSTAQTRWYEEGALGFKVSVPTSWETHAYAEGTDEIRAWTSPDENVALLIRTVPIGQQQATLDMIITVYEQNALAGAQRLVMQDYTLNGVAGKMAGYRWTFNDIPVIVGAFFALKPGTFYALSSIIPQEMFQARTAETDAIMNTFTLIEKVAAVPQSIGGQVSPKAPPPSIGGSVGSPPPSPPPANRPAGPAVTPDAGHVTMVEETAGLEFAIPRGFTRTSAQAGQSQWQGPAGSEDADVKMVIQTVEKDRGDHGNLEEAFLTLIRQVNENASASEVEKRRETSGGGLETVVYAFDLKQAGGTLRFVYVITETANHITYVSFVGPVQKAYRQESHADQVVATLARSGGGGTAASSSPSTPGGGNLRGPAGPHVAADLPGTIADAGHPASGYRFFGENLRMRMEIPQAWQEVRNHGITGYTRYVAPEQNVNAAFSLREIPSDRQAFQQVLAEAQAQRLGTVTINGTEYHVFQSVRNMGPPTNMNMRSDWLVWQHGPRKVTYRLDFTGDASQWDRAMAPVAKHLLMSLKMMAWS